LNDARRGTGRVERFLAPARRKGAARTATTLMKLIDRLIKTFTPGQAT
jgi:hypothetical protein